MTRTEDELEMVLRHVREGKRLVANQRKIVAQLRERGHPVELAEALLANLEAMQELHCGHLARLQG